MKLTIYTDGASRGNPGLSAYGFTISGEDGKLRYEEGEYIGIATNNFAEYTAVLKSLEYLKRSFSDLSLLDLKFLMDSKLVAEQLSGRFKVKSENLKPIIAEIKSLLNNFKSAEFTHIPREKNKLADRLANYALDKR